MDAIDTYLDELAARLRIGPGRARRLLLEAEAHLREAAAREVASGADPETAEQRALERFGTARQVATSANGSPTGQLGSLATGLVSLAVLGCVAVLVGTLLAWGVAALTSTAGVFGIPPGYQPPHARVAHWLAVQPGASDWHAAAAAENADDTLLLRGAFAVACLALCLVALRVVRRQVDAPPGGVVPAIGVTAFGGAGVVLLAGALTDSYTQLEWGRGLWLSDAVAALLAATVCAVALLRGLRTV
jgi:hypothetical protein